MNDRYKLRELVADELRLQRFYRFMDPAGLVVGGNITPSWMRDGKSFWFADGARENTVILRVDGDTGEVGPLFNVARTRRALAELLGRSLPCKGLPFDSIAELDGGRYRFSFEGRAYTLTLPAHSIEPCAGGGELSSYESMLSRNVGVGEADLDTPRSYHRPMWLMEPKLVTEAPSPDRRWFASLKDGNIMLRARADGRTVPLTADGSAQFAWDIEAPRLRVSAGFELSRNVLEPWSPDATALFAVKYDRRAVPDLPFIRYLKREEELSSNKIQRAGGPLDIAHPHVIDVLAKRPLRFDLGNTENQYFVLIGWLSDGSEVLFTRHSRDFKTVDVLAGDPVTGGVRTILSEATHTFVAIQHDVIFAGDNHITILPNGGGLIWRSARSGWNHLYHYALDGTLVRALTDGEFPVVDVVAVEPISGWVYFTAHPNQKRPYDTHLCRVSLGGGMIERLTERDGQNVVAISPTKKTFAIVNSRSDRPFRTDFHTCDGTHLATIQKADTTALQALGYLEPEEFTVVAADGVTELWGVMYKPADFDPKKKYPLVDHLYGGPQVTMVSNDFGLGAYSHKRLDRALAQLGYIVVTLDARGTPERSKAFHDTVYGNWGRHEVADHAAAIQQLAQRHSFIDLDRVGVWGHSWGGYFTIRALAQAPEVFHAGVASAPGADPYDAIL